MSFGDIRQFATWQSWETGVLLLAIDWYTIRGTIGPSWNEIHKVTADWIEFLHESPDIPLTSQRLIVGQKSEVFTRLHMVNKWQVLKFDCFARQDGISALLVSVLPHRKALERRFSEENIRICYIANDRLPAARLGPDGIIMKHEYAGDYLLKPGEPIVNSQLRNEAKLQRECRERIYDIAYKSMIEWSADDVKEKLKSTDKPRWLQGYDPNPPVEKLQHVFMDVNNRLMSLSPKMNDQELAQSAYRNLSENYQVDMEDGLIKNSARFDEDQYWRDQEAKNEAARMTRR